MKPIGLIDIGKSLNIPVYPMEDADIRPYGYTGYILHTPDEFGPQHAYVPTVEVPNIGYPNGWMSAMMFKEDEFVRI